MAELSKRDKNRIKKHVTNCCANYSKEYGCLPLETECYMFSVGFTDSKLCKYYEQAVLPYRRRVVRSIQRRTHKEMSAMRQALCFCWTKSVLFRAMCHRSTSSTNSRTCEKTPSE